MESPPSRTPTRVFLRVRAINNREWARGSNLGGRTHTIGYKHLKISKLRLSLCAKVKLFGFTLTHAHVGTQASAWAVVRPLPAPQFLKEIATHTRTPSCAHPLCLSVCGRDYCAPIMRAW